MEFVFAIILACAVFAWPTMCYLLLKVIDDAPSGGKHE